MFETNLRPFCSKILNISSSFEPDVVLLCVCHTTPTQKLFRLDVFRQAGPPQQVDCLAPKMGNNIKGVLNPNFRPFSFELKKN